MKLIKSIVRPHKVDDVREALEKLNIAGMTVTDVRGHGRQKGHTAVYRGKEYSVTLLPKVEIEVVVPDNVVEDVIEAIIGAARTGEIGDGRVFVLPVEQSYNIRTGEREATDGHLTSASMHARGEPHTRDATVDAGVRFMSRARVASVTTTSGGGRLSVMAAPAIAGAQTAAPPAINQADTAWMLVADRAGAADDAGAGVLLRRPGAVEERAQHDDDELRLARLRRRAVGGRRLLAGVLAPAATGSATCRSMFLRGVGLEPQGTIPHLLFMAYQGTFAIITAALISGAIVERMRFSAYVLFITLWALLVYSPVAHWVWGGGWLAKWGALDFAGGTVVHVNAAVAALVAAIVVGKRQDYPSSSLLPHNVPFTLLGAGLLWFGWFGFNAGSALAASPVAALAFVDDDAGAGGDAGGLDVPRCDAIAQADRRRRGDRDRGRARRDHAGRRLHQPDERDRARRHRRGAELSRR